ncbi:MAG: hypothetical protein ACE5ET_01100 [Gammaproteobacteria bacterium]
MHKERELGTNADGHRLWYWQGDGRYRLRPVKLSGASIPAKKSLLTKSDMRHILSFDRRDLNFSVFIIFPMAGFFVSGVRSFLAHYATAGLSSIKVSRRKADDPGQEKERIALNALDL